MVKRYTKPGRRKKTVLEKKREKVVPAKLEELIENPPEERTTRQGTDADIAGRKNEVEILMATGYSRIFVCQYMSKKYQLSYRQTDRYMKEVRQAWQEDFDADTKRNLIEAIKVRRGIADRCLSEKDYRTALAALDGVAKLAGLFKDRVELTGGISNLNKDEIEKILSEINLYDKGDKP